MIHLPIIYFILCILNNGVQYEFFHVLVGGVEMYIFAYISSFVLSVIFESPIVQLLKLLSQRSPAPRTKKITDAENDLLHKNELNLKEIKLEIDNENKL